MFWSHFVSVCFAMKLFFSFKIHCLQMLQLFQTRDWPFFFHRHTCRAFFCCIIKKYLSHILFWSQFVSVCFAVKFFFSFKIHCLQMLQLFQTRNGPFFFIVTLVALFLAVSSKNIYPIYCFGHSSSQSVLQWNSFSPLKYIVYKCYSCFRPGMGHFFSSSHLSTLVALFLLYHQKIFIPYIVLVTVRLSLFCNEILFLL